MIFVYKLFHGMTGFDVSKFFNLTLDERTRGHNKKLQFKYSRLSLRRSFFSQRSVSVWNNLPDSCVNAPSLRSFKSSLSVYFEQNGFR